MKIHEAYIELRRIAKTPRKDKGTSDTCHNCTEPSHRTSRKCICLARIQQPEIRNQEQPARDNETMPMRLVGRTFPWRTLLLKVRVRVVWQYGSLGGRILKIRLAVEVLSEKG